MKMLDSNTTLLNAFDIHNKELEARKSTITKYATIRKRLARFINADFKADDLEFPSINEKFADRFHRYLMKEFGLGNNTAVTYVWMMGTVIRFAKKRGVVVPVDPTQSYSGKKESKKFHILSIEQLEAIKKLTIEDETTDLVRDLFLYSCYTGLSLEELKEIRLDPRAKVNGREFLLSKRGDNSDVRAIPRLPEIVEIERKYSDERNKRGDQRVFPYLHQLTTGMYLKDIGQRIGLSFALEFKTARHTYCTEVAKKYNLEHKYVSKTLGYFQIFDFYNSHIYRRYQQFEDLEEKLKAFY